ncbi:MAG: molecular chaperone DnaJ [Pirellulales bacterium]|nr:molecular chaperone DnaJ [Pirellulales bacterium]
MVDQRCYYEVLGVERRANSGQITEAYRKLAIRFHPDKNPGDDAAANRFKEAARAFEVLSDESLRGRYDRYGHAGLQNGGGGGQHEFNDMSDIFEAFGDLFGGGMFGGRGRAPRAQKGRDVFCEISLTLLEASRGESKTIHFRRHEECTTCRGSGAKPGTSPQQCEYCGGQGQVLQSSGIFRLQTTCPACRGAGSIVRDKCPDCAGQGQTEVSIERKVTIPAGVDNDVQIRLAGEGEPGANGGPPGDCYCVIEISDHPFLTRDGHELHCEVPLTFSQCALGTTAEAPTLHGPKPLQIPKGTQPGDIIRIRGLGMPDVRGRGVGDLNVHIHVEVPKKLSDRAEELLRELAEEEQADVSPKRSNFLTRLAEYFTPENAENPSDKEATNNT